MSEVIIENVRMQSAAGYYIGSIACEDALIEPYSRETGYYPDEELLHHEYPDSLSFNEAFARLEAQAKPPRQEIKPMVIRHIRMQGDKGFYLGSMEFTGHDALPYDRASGYFFSEDLLEQLYPWSISVKEAFAKAYAARKIDYLGE